MFTPVMDMEMDSSAEMCHTVATFETLRQAVSNTNKNGTDESGKSSPSPCIAVYHGRGMRNLYAETLA